MPLSLEILNVVQIVFVVCYWLLVILLFICGINEARLFFKERKEQKNAEVRER